ncbi:MAG: peptidylprolyl isomerase [Gammaproteobacteria bacterium]|jgi:hypothetical protein
MSLLREPLLHFVVAGLVLFTAFDLLGGDDASGDGDAVVVDRRALLTFLQYRANAFDPDTFGAALDAMTDAELEEVIDAYVDEEILYREAEELGLEQSDNIIRQRMVQKMTFLLGDLTAQDTSTDRAALEAYFAANIDAYAIQPWVTFTHVFFDASKLGSDGALAAAEASLRELNETGAQFNDAPQYGDGFPFLRNYVERTLEYVAGHFGYEFVDALASLTPSADEWQGPIASAYGQHLVLLTESRQRAYPDLDDVVADVERDLAEQRSVEAMETLMSQIRDRYEVRVGAIRSEQAE